MAVNICYEDAFGSELIDGARAAGFLVNVTNDAWYGHSIAAWQHNQIAAMRALELGRPMLRATNTGITSAIAHAGRVTATLPWFTRGVLEVTIDGRVGATPYQRFGDTLVLALSSMVLLYGAWRWPHARVAVRPESLSGESALAKRASDVRRCPDDEASRSSITASRHMRLPRCAPSP